MCKLIGSRYVNHRSKILRPKAATQESIYNRNMLKKHHFALFWLEKPLNSGVISDILWQTVLSDILWQHGIFWLLADLSWFYLTSDPWTYSIIWCLSCSSPTSPALKQSRQDKTQQNKRTDWFRSQECRLNHSTALASLSCWLARLFICGPLLNMNNI